MHHFNKNHKFSFRRDPAIMFPRAPLWLSTGLCAF